MRVALLISGGGSTAERIIRETKPGGFLEGKVTVACLISSRENAGGIQKAKNAGIPEDDIEVLNKKMFPNQETFGEAIVNACQSRGVDVIHQCGWLPQTPDIVIETYKGMMINQHPGPLDPERTAPGNQPRDFGGHRMFGQAVIAAQMLYNRMASAPLCVTATAQRVAKEYDKGVVIAERNVNYCPGDDVSAVQNKLLPIEHEVQLEALAAFATNTVIEIKRGQPLIPEDKIYFLNIARCHAIWLFSPIKPKIVPSEA